MIRRWVLFVVCVLMPVVVMGQGAATRPAAGFDVGAFLAPYVDEQTILVGHVDMGKVDTGAVESYVMSVMDETKVPAGAEERKEVGAMRAAADAFLVRFKQLGGRHVMLVLSHQDIWPNMEPLAVLVKIEAGGDAKGMAAFMKEGLGVPAAEVLKDDVVFAGNEKALARLKGIKAVARPELTLAGSDAAVEGVMAMTADERRAVRELMPVFPQELGGESTEALTREGLVGTLRIMPPPKPSLSVSFVLRDYYTGTTTAGGPLKYAGTASTLASEKPSGEVSALIERMRDLILANEDFKQALEMPELKPMAGDIREMVKEVLTPKNGTVELDDKQIRTLARLLVPAASRAREQAERTASMNNIRQALMGCIMYANDNKGMLPESLDQLVAGKLVAAELLVNPRDQKHRRYVYRRWVPELAKIPNPEAVPLIWEEVDDAGEPRSVGFVDGHVELVRDAKALEGMIKEAQGWSGNTSGGKGMP